MKLQFKALTITLGLAALLGACTSVDSSTPSTEAPSVDSSIELTPDGAEVQNSELETETFGEMGTGVSDELDSETAEVETFDEMGATGTEESYDLESNTTSLEDTIEGEEIIVPDTVGSEIDETSESAENLEIETAPELEPAQ
ncbi:MAG: hypothetical protein ACFCU5_19305 [Pleurocapsa sp.]